MNRLILFRHGRAERDSASGDDFDRRLETSGRDESAAIAATLADLGFAPDLVLVSTAVRTRETWAALEGCFPKAQARFEPNLYLADEGVIREAAEAAAAAGTVMIVGHNPGLQELTVRLLMEGSAPTSLISRAQANFPTSAAAVFLIDAAGRPAYDGLFFPNGRR